MASCGFAGCFTERAMQHESSASVVISVYFKVCRMSANVYTGYIFGFGISHGN